MQSYFPPGDYTSGEVKYRWRCARCNVRHEDGREFNKGDAIWRPFALPDGWCKVGDSIFCPAHKVTIFVDDKLFGTEGTQ